MMNRVRVATIGIVLLSQLVPSAAFAEEEHPQRERFRYAGEITGVVPGQGTFTLLTRAGEELEFQTSDRTHYRSPDGSVQEMHDLKKGMKALVAGIKDEDVHNGRGGGDGRRRPRGESLVQRGDPDGPVDSKGDG